MSWNLFNKPPLTFEDGYKDAKRQMKDLLERGYSEDGAIDKLSHLYEKYCDPKSPTASWLPYGKRQDKYLEGYWEFLASLKQAPFSVPEQIHPETNVNLACDLLEFLSVRSLSSSLPNACIANAPMTGYILAETMYEAAIKQGMPPVEAYNELDSEITRKGLGLDCNNSLQYAIYVNELEAKVIKPIEKLEAMYKMKAYEKA